MVLRNSLEGTPESSSYALVETHLLILDRPTTGLDKESRNHFYSLVREKPMQLESLPVCYA